jgi:hypothetical protein
MEIDVIEMIRSLFANEETRAAMVADPEAAMREQGVEPPAEADWQEAMEQLRVEYGADYESLIAELEERMEARWEELREELEMGEPPAYLGDLMVMGDTDGGFSVMVGTVSVPVMPEPDTGGWEFHHPGGHDVGYVADTGGYYVRDPQGNMQMHEAPPAIEPWEGGHHEPPPAYGEHPVTGNAQDGYTVVIQGEQHQLRYDAERGWEYRSPDAGWVGHGEGGYYHHGAEGTRWVEDYEDAIHKPEPEYVKPEDEYKEPEYKEPEYVKPEDEYKEPEYKEPEYVKPEDEYKEPEYKDPEYKEPEDGYKEPEYAKPEDGYKEPEYAKPEDGYKEPAPEYKELEYEAKPVEEYASGDDYQAVTEMPVADYVEPEPAAPAYEDLPPEMAPADDMADGMMDGA